MRKLKTVLLLVFIFSTLYSYSQNDEDIMIDKTYYGKTLKNVLTDLAHSYDLTIDYFPEDIEPGIISGKRYRGSLDEVLNMLLAKTDLNYKTLGSLVTIRKKGVEFELIPIEYPRKTDFTLSGVIVDEATGESLPFANIKVKNSTNGTSTNTDGYFTLFNVPSDTSVLEVLYVGYKDKFVALSPKLLSEKLVIGLKTNAEILDEVVVTAEKRELLSVSDGISMVSISPKEIKTLPSLGEHDIFRSFQLLPGISGSNESSSGLFVRGGTPDQNLILYDGFSVYHVDHLFGMFSAFNSNAIKDVKLYKGGFESKFGGRVSSVMDITGKDGNENDFNLGGSVSFLSVNGFTEIPLGGNGSIIITGRRSFKSFLYNNIFDSFNSDDGDSSDLGASSTTTSMGGGKGNRVMEATEPSSYFYDLNAKATYKLDKDIFSLSFYNGQDDLDNSNAFNMTRGEMTMQGGSNDITKWGNWGSSGKWSRKWNDVFYSNTLLSFSNYYSERDLSMTRTIIRNEESFDRTSGTYEDNNLQDLSFKNDNEFKIGQNNQLEFGLQTTHYNIDYSYTMNDTISIQERNDNALLSTVYLQDNINLFNKLTLVPGIRASHYSVTNKLYYEPRMSLKFDLTKKLRLKAAWGDYYQFAKRIIRDDIESGSRDFWILADDDVIPVTSSTHYIAGIGYETPKFLFDIEAYYKTINGLSEYTLMYAPSFQQQIDFNEFFYEGTGIAKGIEFLAQKKFGKYTGWIGYTLGQVDYNFPIYGTESFPANHDVTNEFKIVNSYRWKKWTIAGTWIYATGKPYTCPTGAYELTLADGSTADFLSISDKNVYRLPAYHRLDLSATLDFNMGETGIGSIGFSLFNVYNRTNTWYKTFELFEGELIETDVNQLGITPNITLSIKLR